MTAPFVRKRPGGYQMWYASGLSWLIEKHGQEPAYKLRNTVSTDGIVWSSASEAVSLFTDSSLGDKEVVSFGRPWVTEHYCEPRLWFSRRKRAFRDGAPGAYRLFHVPLDALGSDSDLAVQPVQFSNQPASDDWDATMQAYAAVVPFQGDLIMFYNGGNFGQHGCGWARLANGVAALRRFG